ncbi:hypothetical protein DB345_02730 [Spartobacteria bacterium LR76]|nr:hypothetical protein DB345_02730 [Spartobacteria bacterium LR76]
MKPQRFPSRGFTLAEILIVLGVVAALAALAIPALNRALSGAQKAQSVNNLRQIGGAIIAYATDNNGSLPGVNSATSTERWARTLIAQISGIPYGTQESYASSRRLGRMFRSPLDKVVRSDRNDLVCSYGLNFAVQNNNTSGTVTPVKMIAIQQPANTILAGELRTVDNTVNNALGHSLSRLNGTGDFYPDGNLYVMADGSVRMIRKAETQGPPNLWNFSK